MVGLYKIRGVRIIPEFDAPAHVDSGWQQFNENNTFPFNLRKIFNNWGNIIMCYEKEKWNTFFAEPPCGHKIFQKISSSIHSPISKECELLL